MRSKLFNLKRKEREELLRRHKQEREKRVAQRIHAILLLQEGKGVKEVVKILKVSQKTVKRWAKAFVKYGIEGFCHFGYERSGRVCELSREELERLQKFLDEGLRSTKEVMDYIEKEFSVKYSEGGVDKLLKGMGYSYQLPATVSTRKPLGNAQPSRVSAVQRSESNSSRRAIVQVSPLPKLKSHRPPRRHLDVFAQPIPAGDFLRRLNDRFHIGFGGVVRLHLDALRVPVKDGQAQVRVAREDEIADVKLSAPAHVQPLLPVDEYMSL